MKFYARLLFFIALSAQAKVACPSFATAQAFMRNNQLAEARRATECRVKKNPADNDSRLMLSDIEWRQGDSAAARGQANQLLNDPKLDEVSQYRLSDRVHRFRVRADAQVLTTRGHVGNEFSVEGRMAVSGQNSVFVGYRQRGRSFADGPILHDDLVNAGAAWKLADRVYVEGSVQIAFNPVFSPKQVVRLEPHYVFGDGTDISIAAQGSFYKTETIPQIEAGVTHTANEHWTYFARTYLSFANDRALFFGIVGTDIAFSHRFQVRVAAGGGESYDGEHVVNNLVTATVAPTYRLNRSFSLVMPLSADWGSLRNEYRAGLGVECRF